VLPSAEVSIQTAGYPRLPLMQGTTEDDLNADTDTRKQTQIVSNTGQLAMLQIGSSTAHVVNSSVKDWPNPLVTHVNDGA
jgi:hypothetical protein